MLIRLYKNTALVSAIFWAGTGSITIGSIVVSSLDWGINLVMGLILIFVGWFLYLRANNFYRCYIASPTDMQKNPSCLRFLRLDLLLVIISCLVGAVLLAASISRVFGEGYAVFG